MDKIVARINIFFLFIACLPGLVVGWGAYDSFKMAQEQGPTRTPGGDPYRSLAFFFLILIIPYILFALIQLLENRIELRENTLVIRKSSWNLSGVFSDGSGLGRERKIEIDSIKALYIITTTPFVAKREEISQINWRDKVEIIYKGDLGQEMSVVSLFLFPGFKRIVQEIMRERPSIEVRFLKKKAGEI